MNPSVLCLMSGVSTEAMNWEVRLWEKDPGKRYGIFAAACFAAAFGFIMLRNPLPAAFGFIAVVLSAAEYWLPQTFRIDEKGAQRRCGLSVSEMDWPAVTHVAEDENGVRLLPISPEKRLSSFRGVYLRFKDNRETVLLRVRQLMGDN